MPKTVPVQSDAAPTASGRPSVDVASRPLEHLSGLDGLRAVAVLAVVVYHAGLGALSGGFLGVEVFFVISGFLITALLLGEQATTGRIDLVRFWLRRGRRLLPAMFFLLAAVLAFAVVVVPDEIASLRADSLAAFAYATNWHLIAGDQSYFESIGRPSLFNHLWSLAIEEQFYLVWPLLLGGLLLVGRRFALGVTLAGAAGSAVWMAFQFDPASDPSRVYYGTDTRLTGLLLGSALAFVWVPSVPLLPSPATGLSRRRRRKLRTRAAAAGRWADGRLGWALDAVGVAALAGLVAFFVFADAFEPFLYQGGLTLLAFVTVALIAAAVHPRAHIGRLLDVRPLRWVGTRSYSIYLWHWPIFTLTRPGLDLPIDTTSALVLRLALTVVAAEFSYRYVESPIRGGALGRAWAWMRSSEPVSSAPARRWPAPAAAGGLAAVLSILLVSVAMATPPTPPPGMVTDSIDELVIDPDAQPLDQPAVPVNLAVAIRQAIPDGAGGTTGQVASGAAPTVTGASPAVGGATPTVPDALPAAAEPTPSPSPDPSPTPAPTRRQTILAFGESVMIQGAAALAEDLGPVRVDAAVGRHVHEGIKILERRATDGKLARIVIIQLGNNGPFRAGQFDAVMAPLRDVHLVVWVNVRVPRDWEAHNNRIISSGVAKYPNARLVDWYAATEGRPELFWKDGYHPRPKGAELYADLIAAAVH
jgi:peptidoglycan/LPS O-acetylase OafA/YrhL